VHAYEWTMNAFIAIGFSLNAKWCQSRLEQVVEQADNDRVGYFAPCIQNWKER